MKNTNYSFAIAPKTGDDLGTGFPLTEVQADLLHIYALMPHYPKLAAAYYRKDADALGKYVSGNQTVLRRQVERGNVDIDLLAIAGMEIQKKRKRNGKRYDILISDTFACFSEVLNGKPSEEKVRKGIVLASLALHGLTKKEQEWLINLARDSSRLSKLYEKYIGVDYPKYDRQSIVAYVGRDAITIADKEDSRRVFEALGHAGGLEVTAMGGKWLTEDGTFVDDTDNPVVH